MRVRTLAILGFFLSLMMLSSCHSSKKSVNERHHAPQEVVIHKKASQHRRAIVEEAYTWLGTPYLYAGQEKGVGTDCSGMVMIIYESATGEKIPRNSAKQAEFCIPLSADEVNVGDLVFFATGKDPSKVSHVGIILDDDNFIHASTSKGVVISKLSSDYYRRTFMMFGKIPSIK